MSQGFSDPVSTMDVSFTTLPREMSLFLSPMPTGNFNRILSTAIISSASLSLKPMPPFAKITNHGLLNFEASVIQAVCISRSRNGIDDREHSANGIEDLDYLENRTDHLNWWLTSQCWKSPSPSKSFLDSSYEIPACGKLPFHQGKLATEIHESIKIYKSVYSKPNVIYQDIIIGNGELISDEKSLRVHFHYDFYDSLHKLHYQNKKSSKSSMRKPEKILLCKHKFGKGFEKGIQGMREGGVRRIFVPKEFSPVELPGAFDVELIQVCPSLECHIKTKFP